MTPLATSSQHISKLEKRPDMPPPTTLCRILVAQRFACPTNWWPSCYDSLQTLNARKEIWCFRFCCDDGRSLFRDLLCDTVGPTSSDNDFVKSTSRSWSSARTSMRLTSAGKRFLRPHNRRNWKKKNKKKHRPRLSYHLETGNVMMVLEMKPG